MCANISYLMPFCYTKRAISGGDFTRIEIYHAISCTLETFLGLQHFPATEYACDIKFCFTSAPHVALEAES